MARDDEYFSAFDWEDTGFDEIVERSIPDGLKDNIYDDDFALSLIDSVFADFSVMSADRDVAKQIIAEYFEDMYDIDIFEVWDWEDYRDWYNSF